MRRSSDLIKKHFLTLRCPLIISGIRAAMVSFPIILGALPLINAHAETTLNTSSGPVYLSFSWPETSFVVAENAIISTTTDSTIFGNDWANWNVVVHGSVIDNTYNMTAAGAVHLDSATVGGSRLENYGNISATLAGNGISGVRLESGGTVINHQGATIGSAGGYGILSIKPANIINDGSISGYSSAIRLAEGGSITQGATGVISSDSGVGILNDGSLLAINNAGLIQGSYGILARGTSAGSITNSGTILGNTGLSIQGSNGAILRNSGTITGTGGTAVNFSGSNNQLVLQTGSILNGNVVNTGNNNTLALEGNGTDNHNFSGFTSLTAVDNGLWTLGGNITGSGSLVQQGTGTLILNGNSDYSGGTDINAGTLIVGDAAHSGAKLAGRSPVTVASGATLSGNGTIIGPVNNLGTIAALNTLAGHENDAISHLTLGDLVNNGVINLAGGALGNTLTVNGNYVGNNGLLILNTLLDDDNAASDKLIVQGDTSGSTRMQVINMHGIGQQTHNSIEVVSVRGNSNGSFVLQGRAVAGAYEYFLHQGTGGDGNWYLRSALPPAPIPDPDPTLDPIPDSNSDPISDPIPDPDSEPAADPVVSPASGGQSIKRPEAGAYTANLAAANTMFVTTLHDRLGETNYVDALSGETKVTSMWLRQVGGRNSFHDSSNQLKTTSNRYVVQLGGDLAQWSNNNFDRWHLGVMAGYGNSQNDTDSRISSYSTKGSVDGYSLGLYATWFANQADKTGAYLDSWAQYGWFNNQVNGEQLHSESYDSSGLTASVESGYTFKMGESSGVSYFIQPQAQAVWMGVKADDHTEVNGTKVTSGGEGNVMTRLGVRTYMNGHSEQDKAKQRQFQPFVEVNWIHNTQNFSTTMDNVTTVQNGAKNVGEVKTGVEGQINANLNLWGHVGTQVGNAGYNDSSVTFGIKYNF